MDAIEAIKNFPLDRFIMKIATDDGTIEVETTKEGAIFMIKLLRAHKKAIKNGKDGLDIVFEPKTRETQDDTIIIEKFSERTVDIIGAVVGALKDNDEHERMYM